MRRIVAISGVLLVSVPILAGCSGEMSRADACAALAERDAVGERSVGVTDPTELAPMQAEWDELTERLATSAPEPLRGYIIDIRDYDPANADAAAPRDEPQAIADRHGFDRVIFCSS